MSSWAVARAWSVLPVADQPVPAPWLHVLFWAGLRGAIAVGLALSLPADLPQRTYLQTIVFGITLFTLLVQGATTGLLLRRLGLREGEPSPGAPDAPPASF